MNVFCIHVYSFVLKRIPSILFDKGGPFGQEKRGTGKIFRLVKAVDGAGEGIYIQCARNTELSKLIALSTIIHRHRT